MAGCILTSSTPPSAKVTPPRKVHPPRKPFSNCPVPCGPAPPMPPIKQFCLLALSTLKAPEPTSYFTRRGRTFTSEAQYFQMQARTIRPGRFPAPTPASHSAARAGAPFCRVHRPSATTREPFETYRFVHPFPTFTVGPEELKVHPAT